MYKQRRDETLVAMPPMRVYGVYIENRNWMETVLLSFVWDDGFVLVVLDGKGTHQYELRLLCMLHGNPRMEKVGLHHGMGCTWKVLSSVGQGGQRLPHSLYVRFPYNNCSHLCCAGGVRRSTKFRRHKYVLQRICLLMTISRYTLWMCGSCFKVFKQTVVVSAMIEYTKGI